MKSKTATPAAKAKLERLAKRGQAAVDVEHLLVFATLGDPSAAPFLRELSDRYAWPMRKRGYVPLGMWAESIATFLESGAGAVARAVKKKHLDADVAIGLLEEIDSAASIEACLELFRVKTLEATALGAIASIVGRGDTALDPSLEARVRKSAHAFLAKKRKDVDLATTYGLLLSIGDASSLATMEKAPSTSARGPFAGEREVAMKQLSRRLGITSTRSSASARPGHGRPRVSSKRASSTRRPRTKTR